MSFRPLPQAEYNADGANRAEQVKKMHKATKENLARKAEKTKAKVDQNRREVVFEPGEWVWLHMRKERFPNQRKSKLSPRGDGPFRVLEKINDNAYRLELPGEFQISPIFNVADLARFDVGDTVLRSEPSQEGGDDEAPGPDPPDPRGDELEPEEIPPEEVQVPVLRRSARNKKAAKSTQQEFNHLVQILLTVLDREEAHATNLAAKLASSGKMENEEEDQPATHGPVTRAQARLLKVCQSPAEADQDPPRPGETVPFLPMFEGYRPRTIWVVTKETTANCQDPDSTSN